jgi:hypothetical protein
VVLVFDPIEIGAPMTHSKTETPAPPVRPDDTSKLFITRWTKLVRILLVDPSVKGLARAAGDHCTFKTGVGVYAGNGRLARVTGYSDRAVREGWTVLRALGMAERTGFGSLKGSKRTSDTYDLKIPGNWYNLPVLGPNEGAFTCVYCGDEFNPSTSSLEIVNGKRTWKIYEATFCPPPRRRKTGPVPSSCFALWEHDRRGRGLPSWEELDQGVWDLFREARGDDW